MHEFGRRGITSGRPAEVVCASSGELAEGMFPSSNVCSLVMLAWLSLMHMDLFVRFFL